MIDFDPSLWILVGQAVFWLGVALAMSSVPSVLSSRRGAPMSALSWMLSLLLFPWVGTILWWVFGRKALRIRRKKRAQTRAEFLSRRGQPSAIQQPHRTKVQENLKISANAEIQRCDASMLRLFCEGGTAFARLSEALEQGRQEICMLYYLWEDDATGRKVRDILVRKAKEGVKVRVLVDAIGSFGLDQDFWEPLVQANGEVRRFMPPRFWTKRRPSLNFRNHRKIVVIDHEVAFTGGMNIGDHYAGCWKDLHLETRGQSVAALFDIFAQDWFFTTGQFFQAKTHDSAKDWEQGVAPQAMTVISSGPDSPQPWIHDHYFRAMASAKERIWIATPYFVPTESITTALRTAAMRGIDVRILVPGKSDRRFVQWATRAYYPELVGVGVKIFEYQAQMMHAKVWLIDAIDCAVGSANLDPRSFRLNFEVSCVLQCPTTAQTLDAWFVQLQSQSTAIDQASLANTPRWQVLRDSAAHLLSPLL